MHVLKLRQKTIEESKVEGERLALPLTLAQGEGGSASNPGVGKDYQHPTCQKSFQGFELEFLPFEISEFNILTTESEVEPQEEESACH